MLPTFTPWLHDEVVGCEAQAPAIDLDLMGGARWL
jgi:hypothetical protein